MTPGAIMTAQHSAGDVRMTDAEKIAAGLSEAQKRLILSLTPEWQSDGYSKVEADILWALDERLINRGGGPLVDCRLHQPEGRGSTYQHRLLKLGLAVRAIIQGETE